MPIYVNILEANAFKMDKLHECTKCVPIKPLKNNYENIKNENFTYQERFFKS